MEDFNALKDAQAVGRALLQKSESIKLCYVAGKPLPHASTRECDDSKERETFTAKLYYIFIHLTIDFRC